MNFSGFSGDKSHKFTKFKNKKELLLCYDERRVKNIIYSVIEINRLLNRLR